MATRKEYSLALASLVGQVPPVTGSLIAMHAPRPIDQEALADLLVGAHQGTIDFRAETRPAAFEEVEAYFRGQRGGPPLLAVSRLGYSTDILVAACLLAKWNERRAPWIAYLMVRAGWQHHDIGLLILWTTLQDLRRAGYRQVRAVITEQNSLLEPFLLEFGFLQVA